MDLIWASLALGCGFGVAARLGSFCLLRGLVQFMERPPAGRRAMAPWPATAAVPASWQISP